MMTTVSMKGSDFIFHHVHLLNYKFHKVNFKRSGSYIDSPGWIKKATVNTINKKDNKCLNHKETKNDLQRILKNLSSINY